MGEPKPGWRRVRFGEVVRLVSERCDPVSSGIERFVGLEHIEPGNLRVRSWGDVADGTTFTNLFRPGQVLFGKRRAYQRKVAVADFDGVCSGDIYVLESANPGRLLPELLPFICQTDAFFEHAVGTSAGSLSPRTNWTSLTGYEFALPPLEEQRRLVEFLSTVKDVVSRSVDMAKALENVESALLADRFPSERVCPTQPTVPLAELAEVSLGYKVSPVHRGERTTLPIVTVAQLQDGWFDLSNVRETTIPHHMVSSFRPQLGTLLVTEGGNLDQLGRGAVWRGQLDDCVFQNHVFAIKPKSRHTLVEFLEGLMRSPRGREFFLRNAKRTSNLATIDKRKVNTMPVPVVAPAVQAAWVEHYLSVRHSLVEATRRVAEARNLLRATSACLQGLPSGGMTRVH
jgi:type I restriction enzyme, S subunit